MPVILYLLMLNKFCSSPSLSTYYFTVRACTRFSCPQQMGTLLILRHPRLFYGVDAWYYCEKYGGKLNITISKNYIMELCYKIVSHGSACQIARQLEFLASCQRTMQSRLPDIHYCDVIIGAIASQITRLVFVYSTV